MGFQAFSSAERSKDGSLSSHYQRFMFRRASIAVCGLTGTADGGLADGSLHCKASVRYLLDLANLAQVTCEDPDNEEFTSEQVKTIIQNLPNVNIRADSDKWAEFSAMALLTYCSGLNLGIRLSL